MATMQVSVLRKAGDIGVEEREVPTPGRGEVLVEIGSVGVCGSDVHYYEHGRIGRFVVERRSSSGTRRRAVIVEVGPGVDARCNRASGSRSSPVCPDRPAGSA